MLDWNIMRHPRGDLQLTNGGESLITLSTDESIVEKSPGGHRGGDYGVVQELGRGLAAPKSKHSFFKALASSKQQVPIASKDTKGMCCRMWIE